MKLWFDTLVLERRFEAALELIERIHRHQYAASQPLGGRVLSLRWLLEAPEALLSEDAVAQRQDLLTRYPDYVTLANEARGLVERLRGLPVAPEANSPDRQAQREIATQLADVAQRQETYLGWIALRREPVEPTFKRPVPLLGSDSVVPAQTAIVLLLETPQGMHVFSVIDGASMLEATINRKQLAKAVGDVVQALGNESDKNAVDLAQFPETKWRPEVDALYKLLFPNRDISFWAALDETVVVPDGVLWYAPWDLLLNAPGQAERTRVRCCPLVSLAIPNPTQPPQFPRTLLTLAKFSDAKLAPVLDAQLAQAKAIAPSLAELRSVDKTPIASLGASVDSLVVWSPPVRVETKDVLDVSLTQIEDDKATAGLETWAELPFGGPRIVVLPQWSTSAANGRVGDGRELFLASCNLLAMGAQTALVSRWPTGLATSSHASAEFVSKSANQSAIDAWHATIAAVQQTPLDLGEGSRVKKPKEPVADAKSDHPFFWSGYLLIDTGWRPAAAAAEDATAEGADK
jgi:hypothetical protein